MLDEPDYLQTQIKRVALQLKNTYSKERYAEQATEKMLAIPLEGCYNQKSVQEVTFDRVRYRRC